MLAVGELVDPATIEHIRDVASLRVAACDIDDIVQDTMVIALQHRQQYQPGNLWAWLGRIACNCIYDIYRRPNVVEYRGLSEKEHPLTPELDDGLSHELERALSHLSDIQRRVLLDAACGLSPSECAKGLGVPSARVCRWLFSARKRIRETLELEERSYLLNKVAQVKTNRLTRVKVNKSLQRRCGWCGRENVTLYLIRNTFGHCGYICRRKECSSHLVRD